MQINADFSQRVVVRPGDGPWTASPALGVDRRFLDRIGGEQARATSVVRYPAGTWLRSPHLSRHAPFSREGTTILVKVGHLDEDRLAAWTGAA